MVALSHTRSPKQAMLPAPGALARSALSSTPAPLLTSHPSSSQTPRATPVESPHPPASAPVSTVDSGPSASTATTSAATGGASSALTSGKTQTVFIHKLYDMLEDPSLSHLIWWSPSNDSFFLYPGEEFSNVLAQYFKHTNIASFIRQLNMYGFHKVNDNFQSEEKQSTNVSSNTAGGLAPNQATRWEFRHSTNQFRKGDIQSLSSIKRKSSKVINSQKEIVNLKTIPPTSSANLDDQKPEQQYHQAMYQQLVDQMHGSPSLPHQSLSPSVPIYAPPMIAHHTYPPLYMNGVPSSNVPHSPNSPPFPDHGGISPSNMGQPSWQQSLLQPQLRLSSLQNPPLNMEQSMNLKLIEMTNSINNLKQGYSDLSSRYEVLQALYHRSQSDLLRLTEIFEKNMRGPEPEPRAPKDNDHFDRSKTKTPVDKMTTPGVDTGMSPMTVKPGSKYSELEAFKQQLQDNINRPPTYIPQQRHNQPQGSYHLNDTLGVSKVPFNVVPQHYPINPNYTLYNKNPEIPGSRQFNFNAEDLKKPQAPIPMVSRHVSVLMDPLQPLSGRNPVKPEESLVSSTSAKLKEKAPAETSAPQFVQKYQPVAFHQAPMHAYYQHIHSGLPNQQRTVSLPILEKLMPSNQNVQQRHSTTTILPNETISRSEDAEDRGLMFPRTQVLANSNINSQITSKDHIGGEPNQVPQSPRERAVGKNQLPSVLELDKSIKSNGGRVRDLLLSDGEDEHSKKRKLGT